MSGNSSLSKSPSIVSPRVSISYSPEVRVMMPLARLSLTVMVSPRAALFKASRRLPAPPSLVFVTVAILACFPTSILDANYNKLSTIRTRIIPPTLTESRAIDKVRKHYILYAISEDFPHQRDREFWSLDPATETRPLRDTCCPCCELIRLPNPSGDAPLAQPDRAGAF